MDCRGSAEREIGPAKSRSATPRGSGAAKGLLGTISALIVISVLLAPPALGDEAGAAAVLTGDYSDRGADLDGDGLYDLLIVEAGVFVSEPGEYSLMGFLFDPQDGELVWSIDHARLEVGDQTMLLDFDGKTIQKSGTDGPYRLRQVVLSSGSSQAGQKICDYAPEAYTTSPYGSSEFTDPLRSEKTISGTGSGELLLTFTAEETVPVFSGRYSLDLVGIKIPPLSVPPEVTGSKTGYSYRLPGIFIPNKPNNFTVAAEGAENLNIGLKKPQGERIRTWVTTQVEASEEGIAAAETDLISPGSYHVKIFGDAAEDAAAVNLTMTMEKLLVVEGDFSLGIDTTGFPSGSYRIAAEAKNGSLRLDRIEISGLSIED
ncbi:hypothetical protein, partial [Methanocrinis sp.]|uniref:hypothetical protein n=1 Tax=Methanocrinis sp. TaxID=3101522 RepID=UPI003D13D535